ncbi:hypothetical protein V5O48_012842 [Marasmius crinis-equi]|uniref:Cytochrome P450 n=1 Tax=Marasmius crinis-equi TaxID=585013 RepID=A0ABR3F1Q7_9AGAR
MSTVIVLASVALAATILHFLTGRRPAKPPYPPGPPPRLLTGNLYDVPKSKPWKTYHEWSKAYGSGLVHYQVNSKHTVIINSKELSDRMLEKRSRIYSDRPYIPMVDLLGWAPINAGFMGYTDTWRKHRRLYQQGFRPDASRNYNSIQSTKTAEFITNLREDPANFLAHIRTLAAAAILATIYGYDISPTNDYFVDLAEKAVGTLVLLVTPAAAIVNMFPVLRHLPLWFPVFDFQKSAVVSRGLVQQMIDVPYEYVRSNMKAGTAKPCLLSQILERHDVNDGDKDQELVIKGVCATGYGGTILFPEYLRQKPILIEPSPTAGADTTVSAMETFFLAMGMHPDVQKKAQNELNAIVGRGRTPGYEERPNLPYIEAIFRETLRAMSRNETVYPNPESFNPERFLKNDGTCNDVDDAMFIFGAGRRICPGRHFASATLWMAISSVLAEFDIGKPTTVDGKDIRSLEDANYSDVIRVVIYVQSHQDLKKIEPITERLEPSGDPRTLTL